MGVCDANVLRVSASSQAASCRRAALSVRDEGLESRQGRGPSVHAERCPRSVGQMNP